MKEVEGNLLDLALRGQFDAIVHGCNCFCNMGAGIALQIMQRFPEAYVADKATEVGDKTKLGTYTKAFITRGNASFVIINAYTQYGCGTDIPRVNYEALDECFMRIYQEYGGLRIGYPLIGAGLAGGDWNIIAPIIDKRLSDCDHTLVRFIAGK